MTKPDALLIAVLTGSTILNISLTTAEAVNVSVAPGAIFKDCEDCPEMVVIPSGTFEMGSDRLNQMRDNELRPEGPIRSVNISKPFAAGRFEITKANYDSFVSATGYLPSQECITWSGRDPLEGVTWEDPQIGRPPAEDEPVVCVSWIDTKEYVDWLAKDTGQPYRLLSEAEWEYVAKADSSATWPWGEDERRICEFGNVFDQTGTQEPRATLNSNAGATAAQCDDGYMLVAPVGQFKPNAFGLYDTIGNVWEWVEDCSLRLYAEEPVDGSAFQVDGDCEKRAVRSGSWRSRLSRHEPTFRGRDPEHWAYYMFGFRVARDLY